MNTASTVSAVNHRGHEWRVPDGRWRFPATGVVFASGRVRIGRSRALEIRRRVFYLALGEHELVGYSENATRGRTHTQTIRVPLLLVLLRFGRHGVHAYSVYSKSVKCVCAVCMCVWVGRRVYELKTKQTTERNRST